MVRTEIPHCFESMKSFLLLEQFEFPGMIRLHISILSLQFVCVESLVTAIVDMFPEVFRKKYRREFLILAIAIICYFLGLILLTEVQ